MLLIWTADVLIIVQLHFIELVQGNNAAVFVDRGLRFEFGKRLRYLVRFDLTPRCLPLRYLVPNRHHVHLLLRHGPLLILAGLLSNLLRLVQRRRLARLDRDDTRGVARARRLLLIYLLLIQKRLVVLRVMRIAGVV